MRRWLAFLWLRIRCAFPGNAAAANDWQWVVANPIWQSIGATAGGAVGAFMARYWHGAPMMSPDTPVGIFLGGAFGFVATWILAFAIRFFKAPATLYYQEKERSDQLNTELIAIKNNPIPDLSVDVFRLPIVGKTPDNPPPDIKQREGIYIFLHDIRFTNKSDSTLLIEMQLRVFLSNEELPPYFSPVQETIPFPGMEMARETQDASIGEHIGRDVRLGPRDFRRGYLTYFVPKLHATGLIGPFAQMSGKPLLDFVAERKMALVVFERMSGQQREISLNYPASINFKDDETPNVSR
jgi:hypothetical protein